MRNNLHFKYLILSIFFLSVISCRKYESREYFENENNAIIDIIPELIDLNYMIKSRDKKELKLIVNRELDIKNISFIEEKFDYYSTLKEKDSLKDIIKREKNGFKPFTDKKLLKRDLRIQIKYDDLEIVIKSFENKKLFETFQKKSKNENILGCLIISRIIFDKKYESGYMTFGFYCGDGCFWSNNIQIKKINEKWIISERFAGGIA